MKHNTMKRVLAATLSLLTVASPMGVNVGGFLTQGSAIVANAYENELCAIDFSAATGITTVNGLASSFITNHNISPEVGNDVTIQSKYKLTFTGIDATETGSNGAYTYTFVVPDLAVASIEDAKAAVTVTPLDENSELHVYTGDLEKNEDGTYKAVDLEKNPEIATGQADVKQGTKVTILADTPFEIRVDGSETAVATGRWNATAGVYVLENYWIENADFAVVGTPHVPIYTYTGDRTNVIKATDTTDNASVIDETAASVWGYYRNTGDDAQDNPKLQLANRGRYIYDQDDGIDIRMTRANELLGTGANRESNDEGEQYAFKYKITKDGEVLNGLEGTIKMGELLNNDFYDAETGDFDFGTVKDQGHYEVTITVWGTDNEAAAMYVNYIFDIVPATLDVHSFDLLKAEKDNVARDDSGDVPVGFARVPATDFLDTDGVWKVHVPSDDINTDSNGIRYYDGVTYDTKGVTVRLNEEFAAKFKDLKYGPEGYQVIQSQISNDLNVVNHIMVEIYDPNYGGSAEKPVVIDIPWMLVEEEEQPYLYLDGYTDLEENEFLNIRGRHAVDADAITKAIMGYHAEYNEDDELLGEGYDNLKFTSHYDINKISFQYMPESRWDSEEGLNQLDALIDGVPTEDGRYKVYLCYEGELVENYEEGDDDEDEYEFMYVSITKSDYTLDFGEDVLEITYGDEVVLPDYTVLDFVGETADVTFDADDFTFNRHVNAGLLDAGYHLIDVAAVNEDGVVAAGDLLVHVNPKEITRNMVGFINREYQDGQTVYVWNPYTLNGKITATDTFSYIDTDGKKKAMTNYVEMAAVGGVSSQTRIGTYNVDLSIRTQQEPVVPAKLTQQDIFESYRGDDKTLYNAVMTKFAEEAAKVNEQYGQGNPITHFSSCYFTTVLGRNPNMTYDQYAALTLTEAYEICHCNFNDQQMAAALGVETTSTMGDVFNKFLEKWPDLSTVEIPVQSAKANYTITGRKLRTTWNIVGDDGRPTFVDFETASGLQKARLFDGGKLHVAINRGVEPEKAEDKTTVKSFGVIIDKAGKLAAPENDNDIVAYSAATAALVLDNGFTTSGKDLSATEAAKYTRGANIQIVDASIGVWVRPYYVDNDGQTHYGNVEYFSLPEVTQAELQLRVPGVSGAPVTREEVTPVTDPVTYSDVIINQEENAGYDYMDKTGKQYTVGQVEEVLTKKDDNGEPVPYLNRHIYYFAAVKNTLDAIGAKDADGNDVDLVDQRKKVNPERFGVILDKNGVVEGGNYEAAEEQLKVDDSRFTTTKAKTNNNHGENAYGANITPVDVFTGVWVRPYVDFGNNLIVYGEPVYFESFNDYYIDEYGVDFESMPYPEYTKAITTNTINPNEAYTEEKFRFYATPAVDDEYDDGKWYDGTNTLSYQKVGVVVDKTNSVKDLDKLSLDSKGVVSGSWDYDAVDAKGGLYGADLFKTTGTINVRPYIVIDDTLTLYGPVQSVTWDDAVDGVDSWYPAE